VAAMSGVLALCWTTGCAGFWVAVGNSNGGGPGSTTSDRVYVANATAATLSGYAVGTGTLTAVTNSPYSLPFYPTAVAVNPTNSIVFVGGNSEIIDFAINSDGSLSALNGGLAVGYASVASMDISPDGHWLLALDQNNITLDEFQINSTTGLLTSVVPATAYPVPSGGNAVLARAVKFSPLGDYVFLALGTAGDVVYSFNTSLTSGALASPQALSLGLSSLNSDNALAVSSDEKYLFIARSGVGGGLAVYTIGSGGALLEVGSPTTAGTQPFSVVINTTGTDVYVANRGSNTISGFSIGSGGVLTALSGSPYQSGSAVASLAVDSSGNYLLAAASSGSPDLTLYSYDSATVGKLDFSTSIATGTDPTGPIAIVATH